MLDTPTLRNDLFVVVARLLMRGFKLDTAVSNNKCPLRCPNKLGLSLKGC